MSQGPPVSAFGEDDALEALDSLARDYFSQFVQKPVESNAFYLEQEIRLSGMSLEEFLEEECPLRYKKLFERMGMEPVRDAFAASRDRMAESGKEYLDLLQSSDGVMTVDYVHPDKGRTTLISDDNARKASTVYDMATVHISGRTSLMDGVSGRVFRDIAEAAEGVSAAERIIYEHSVGDLGPDAFYSRMAMTQDYLADKVGGKEAQQAVDKYLDWYASETETVFEAIRDEKHIARESRFPLPGMFERNENPNVIYSHECDNGVNLRLEQLGDGSYTWTLSTADASPFADHQIGIADTFEEAYSQLYMAGSDMFSGIVDPASPKRGATTLDKLRADPKNMEPPRTTQNPPSLASEQTALPKAVR